MDIIRIKNDDVLLITLNNFIPHEKKTKNV